MEDHRQSPVAISRSVYPLTPTHQQTIQLQMQVPLATTPPDQCASTPIQSTRKVISCRRAGCESELAQFDALLESYNEWLALHPCPLSPQSAPLPSHSPSIQESYRHVQRQSRYIAGSPDSWFLVRRVTGSEQVSPNKPTSHAGSPRSQCILHQTTCKEHPGRVLAQSDAGIPGQLLPTRLEDLFSEFDSSKSGDENSICSITYNRLCTNPPKLVTDFSRLGHTRDNVSSSLLKPPIKEAVLLADRFYHRHLLCWGMKGLVHSVLDGRRLKEVATAHDHWRLTNLRNGWKSWQLKARNQRLKFVDSTERKSCFNKLKILEKRFLVKVFQAWRLFIYHCNLKQLCEMCTEQKSMVVQQACFDAWLFQAALCVGDNILCKRLCAIWQFTLCRKTFKSWYRLTKVSKSKYRGIDSLHNKNVLKSHFFRWRESYIFQCQQKVLGRELQLRRKKQILKRLWHFMKEQYQRLSLCKEAVALKESRLLFDSLMAWKKAKMRIVMESSADQVSTFRRYLSQWRAMIKKVSTLEENSNLLRRELQKHTLSGELNTWKRQLQSQRLARTHCHKKLLCLVQRYFILWQDHVASCYHDTALKFTTKLEYAFNVDQFTTYKAMKSCLAVISLNLGLIHQAHFEQMLSHDDENGKCTVMDFSTHSTRVANRGSQLKEKQELSKDESSKVISISDLSESWCHSASSPDIMLHHNSTTKEPLIQCQLLMDDMISSSPDQFHTASSSSQPIPRVTSGIDIIRTVSSVPLKQFCPHIQFCTCLKPDVVQHLNEVKQKLDELSASRNESIFPSQSHTPDQQSIIVPSQFSPSLPDGETSLITQNLWKDRSPILTPPLEFTAEGDGQQDVVNTVSLPFCKPPVQSVQLTEIPAIIDNLIFFIRTMKLYPCSLAFYSWRNYSTKKSDLKKKLKHARVSLQLQFLRSILYTWRKATSQVAALKVLEENVKRASSHNLLKYVIATWKEVQNRQTCFNNMETKAQTFYRFHQIRKNLNHWKEQCDYLISIRSTNFKLSHNTMARVWKRWRIALIRQNVSIRSAYRSNQILLQQVFVAWQSAAPDL